MIVGLFAVVTTNAAIISLNFNPGGTGSVAGTEVVGLNGIQADSWVDLGASAIAVDIDGVAGSATIDYVSAYNFTATPTSDGSQNSLMMKRAIRVGGPGDETITISGLGTDYTTLGYDVYVYFGTDNHGRTHRFLVGGTAVSGKEQLTATWQGSFIQTSADADVGNYMVASGLTAGNFTIVDNGTSPGKGGIAGIEIVSSDHAVVPSVSSFSIDSSYVTPGSTITLLWETFGATSIAIDQGIGDVTSISTDGVGSTQVVVNATTTYTLTASNPEGSATGEAGITVGPPLATIDSFSVDRSYVTTGEVVTLSWETANSTGISIEPGIGDVFPISADGDGSTQIVVNATTTYTLTASNLNSSATAEATVLVLGGVATSPNIVFFVVDDMGPQDTSVPFNVDTNGNPVAYNFNSYYVTPNMESLAADGMRFTTAYAHSVCSPTRTGIMTGQNSARHAVTDYLRGLNSDDPINWRNTGMNESEVTLMKLFQAGDYRTIHAGKAHFANSAVDIHNLGFDVNIAGGHWGQPPAGYINAGTAYGGLPGLEAYDGSSMFLTKALSIEANQAIEDAVVDGDPFLLYMSFYAVHTPYATNPDATGDYSAAVNSYHTMFATMVEGMDIAVGSIRQKLVDLGVAENTLVIFIGDNGTTSPACNINLLPDAPFSDWPMRGKKGARWEGGIRVPMIAAWAAANTNNAFQQATPILANSIETDIVTSWDIPVTLLNIAGLPGDPDFGQDRHDLSPYFAGTPGGPHRPQEVLIHFPHNHNNDYFSLLRQGDMKLIYNYQNNTHQLFNLADDPTESVDLAASQPETLTRMTRALAQRLDTTWGAAGPLIPRVATTAPNGNVVSITNDPSVDVDADGLADTVEDPDLDGLVDAGELDPDNDNTDGDGTIDGAEVRTGTDPLDPSDDFVGEWAGDGTGGFTATWPSAPGAFYEIQTTDDLTEWIDTPLATGIPANDPGTTTSYTIPASGDPQRFYRIGLLP